MTLREWRDLLPRRKGQWALAAGVLFLVAFASWGWGARFTGGPKTCADFATQREAQSMFRITRSANLDRDGDSIACESLP